jgi:DNA helicase IV
VDQRRLDHQLDVLAAARKLLPASRAPYHAHLRLRYQGGREADILLGNLFRRGEGVTIIDWRTAPLAEVFFSYSEGEEYELEVQEQAGPWGRGARKVQGVVLQRNLVVFQHGELVEIAGPMTTLSRRAGGWREAATPPLPRLLPRPPGLQTRPPSPVDVTLDPAQRAVVDLPPRETVLILGEAGCGKTTVALHRLRALSKAGGDRFRAACIVPNEGLRRLIESLLHRLGLSEVETWTWEQFASKQARRVFPDLRRRESESAHSAVVRLKRHEALRPVLEKLAARPPPSAEDPGTAYATRMPAIGKRRARLATREDLHALFGDRKLMDEVVALSGMPLAAAAETVEHTRIQFTESSERAFAHVEAERLQALDGRPLDDGTPAEVAETVDAEDYAVIFELERLRALRARVAPASPSRYDCLLIDEAQELAPLELALLGRCVSRGGTLIVAGDSGQQIDPAANFRGWDATMHELGAQRHHRAVLEVSYRCPPEVTAFARALREPLGKAAFPLLRFHDECHLAAWLVEALRELDSADPTAAAAIVCRSPPDAAQLARVLELALPVHLALDGAFHFGPGAQVTCVPEVKGLEFDHVVVPDAGAGRYADTPEARRALYVAATRASSQLVLAAAGPGSPLIG